MKKNILFVLTKYFPFGTMEKYINHELPLLSAAFEKVIIIPTEYFGDTSKEKWTSPLPDNVEVFALNEAIKKKNRSAWGMLPRAIFIWLYEFIHNPHRRFLIRHFNKNKNVLLYQLLSSKVLGDYLQDEQFKGKQLSFYSYWFHHSTLILALLKSKGKIEHFISRAHAIDLYNEDWPLAGDKHKPLPFGFYKMKHIDQVAAISEHGKAHLMRKYPKYKNKITRSYLGVDDHGLGPTPSSPPFVIVTCSNFNVNKRLDLIPDILRKIDFKVKWVHFGTGGDGEIAVKEKIKNLPEHIQVEMKGYVPNEQIASYYKSNPVNLFLNLSELEGLPVSIMEAISFGIPVIATAVFGTPELVSKGNGWLIPSDFSIDEVVEHVKKLNHEKELQQKMSAASRAVFVAHFIAQNTYGKFISELLLPSSNKS